MEKKAHKPNKIYRLTLAEDITHKKIGAFRFSKLGFIITVITFVVVTYAITYSAIAFTPLRETIPGYPNAYSKQTAISNAIKIDSLENVISRWEIYAENLNHVLNNEKTTSLDSLVKIHSTRYLKDVSAEKIASQDSLLRKEYGKQ